MVKCKVCQCCFCWICLTEQKKSDPYKHFLSDENSPCYRKLNEKTIPRTIADWQNENEDEQLEDWLRNEEEMIPFFNALQEDEERRQEERRQRRERFQEEQRLREEQRRQERERRRQERIREEERIKAENEEKRRIIDEITRKAKKQIEEQLQQRVERLESIRAKKREDDLKVIWEPKWIVHESQESFVQERITEHLEPRGDGSFLDWSQFEESDQEDLLHIPLLDY